jgi:hypothetical protein
MYAVYMVWRHNLLAQFHNTRRVSEHTEQLQQLQSAARQHSSAHRQPLARLGRLTFKQCRSFNNVMSYGSTAALMQLRQLTISADSGGVNLPSCVGVGFIWGDTRCNRHRIRHKPASKQQGNSDNNILALYTIVNASTSVQHVLATLPPHRSYSLHSLLLHQPLNVLCDAPSCLGDLQADWASPLPADGFTG